MRLQADMFTTMLAKMGKNETVSRMCLLNHCSILDCNVGSIMDAIKTE